MNIPNTLLANIATFVVVADTKNFSKTAELLHITPSAVSHQMRVLESHLGVRLFKRKSKGVELTTAGKLLNSRAATGINHIGQGVNQARLTSNKRMVIAAIPSVAQLILMPHLHQLKQLLELEQIEIVSAHQLVDFSSANVDCHIHFGDGHYLANQVQWLGNEYQYPVAHSSLFKQFGQDLQSLISHLPLIEYNAGLEDRPGAYQWQSWLVKNELEQSTPKVAYLVNDVAQALMARHYQQGICLGWHQLVKHHLSRNDLQSLDKMKLQTEYDYYLVSPKQGDNQYAIQQLAQWITQYMSN